VLVESVTCGLGMGMQAEELPSTKREHRRMGLALISAAGCSGLAFERGASSPGSRRGVSGKWSECLTSRNQACPGSLPPLP
jgi:hypothetical protein